jgi:hypothetical protein
MASKLKGLLLEANQEVPKQMEKLISLQKNSKRSFDSYGGGYGNNNFKKRKMF